MSVDLTFVEPSLAVNNDSLEQGMWAFHGETRYKIFRKFLPYEILKYCLRQKQTVPFVSAFFLLTPGTRTGYQHALWKLSQTCHCHFHFLL